MRESAPLSLESSVVIRRRFIPDASFSSLASLGLMLPSAAHAYETLPCGEGDVSTATENYRFVKRYFFSFLAFLAFMRKSSL